MDLDEIRAFVALVEARSFVGAARTLGFARATLRRRIDELEARAGVRLVTRTKTGVLVTPAGELLAARGRQLLDESASLLSYVRDAGREPSGVVRLVVPVGLPPETIPLTVGPLRARYPKLSFDIRYAEDPLSQLLADFDLAVHFGARTPEGPWTSHELFRMREWLVANHDYLRRHGTPTTKEDLAVHAIYAWRGPGRDAIHLPLLEGGRVAISPALVSADIHHVRECAVRGLGIAYVPDGQIPSHDRVELVPVLERVVGRMRTLRMVVPRAIADVPKIRAIVDSVQALRGTMLADDATNG